MLPKTKTKETNNTLNCIIQLTGLVLSWLTVVFWNGILFNLKFKVQKVLFYVLNFCAQYCQDFFCGWSYFMFPFSSNFDSDLSLIVALAPSIHFELTNASHSTSSVIFLHCHFSTSGIPPPLHTNTTYHPQFLSLFSQNSDVLNFSFCILFYGGKLTHINLFENKVLFFISPLRFGIVVSLEFFRI